MPMLVLSFVCRYFATYAINFYYIKWQMSMRRRCIYIYLGGGGAPFGEPTHKAMLLFLNTPYGK